MTARPSLDLLDGHLLRVLCVLLEERSVSRAARKLDATSRRSAHALKRLRDIFADPLLVRRQARTGAHRTRVAARSPARAARDAMAQLTATPSASTRARGDATFRVGSPDYLAPTLLAAVLRRLRTEAPHCASIAPARAGPSTPKRGRTRPARRDHRNWPDRRAAAPFAAARGRSRLPGARGHRWPVQRSPTSAISPPRTSCRCDTRASSAGSSRRTWHVRAQRDARVSVPYFAFAPHVVAETDLVHHRAAFAEPYTHTLPS